MGRHSASGKGQRASKAWRAPNRHSVSDRTGQRLSDARPLRVQAAPKPATEMPPHVQEELKRRKRKRALAITGVSVLVLILVLAASGWAFLRSIQGDMQVDKPHRAALKAALKVEDPGEPFTVLLLGADYRPKETTWRTDTIILAKIDPKAKKLWMLSIPRDTRVNIPGEGYHKINQSHALGGPELTVKSVEALLGIPINHYAEVNFRGFKNLVDSMGGVWIDVPVEIDDWKADSSPGHRAKHIEAGPQVLDGEHALTFVRSRDFPDADFSRMKNQQIFFAAVADQIATKTSVARVPLLVKSIAPYITTDMSVTQMMKTAQALRTAGSKNLFTATLKGEWKSPYVWLDEAVKEKLVADLKAGRSFDSTVTPEASLAPADISVSVRNGGGVGGSATGAASLLEKAGYTVSEVGNAKAFTYSTTLVIYDGENKAAAEQVAARLPSAKVVNGNSQYNYATRVLVVVGKDWSGSAGSN